jgi:hypothetical protein
MPEIGTHFFWKVSHAKEGQQESESERGNLEFDNTPGKEEVKNAVVQEKGNYMLS